MTNQRKNFLTVFFIIAILGTVLSYVFIDLRKSAVVEQTQSAAKNTEVLNSSQTQSGQAEYKIISPPKEASKLSIKLPDLNRPLVNYSHLDTLAFKVISDNTSDIVKKLTKNLDNEQDWLNLSVYRKMLGDYEGAVQVLDYIIVSWPSDYAPYNNLADLYQFYIKNYPLAEKNWLKVIELKPDYLQAYENLYGLYKDLYKEKQTLTLSTLLKGLDANPKSVDLMVYIARYYRTTGNNAQAKAYYNKAVTEAEAQKNEKLVGSLKAEAVESEQ